MLQVQRVSKSFGGLLALNDVSLTINQGEVVGLIGPNGSGKSTLFNLITGALPASSGTILFQSEDITKLPAHQVAQRGIARTFQLVRPFLHLSTLDNVVAGSMYGPAGLTSRPAAEEHAYAILEQVDLAHKAALKAHHLTVMERKWLEVARALAGKPHLLLLDEFMAGLNPTEVSLALALIQQLNANGITLIIVEHIVKAITTACQRVIVLNAGKLIAQGTPAKVVADPNVVTAYLGTRYAKH